MRISKLSKLPKIILVILFILNSTNISAQTYGPFLTDVWGGVNCKDSNGSSVYPLNYDTPSHCSPGCVAISLSQILHFYKWPKVGIDNNVYSENYNGTQFRHSAAHDGVFYDWDNMQDEYYKVSSSDISRKAVGELVYHVDVALEMDFEPSGSTSNVNRVPGVQNHFRFSGHYKELGSYSDFWTRMQENLKNGHPVQVAVGSSTGSIGHAFVIDGYRESDGFYHVNWGWWDKNNYTGAKINLWYDVENGHLGLGYDEITGAVFDFFPIPQISEITKTGTGNEFTVNWITSDNIVNDEYTLEQKIDDDNWTEVAVTTNKYYTINPSGKVYQFRVKAKTDGSYYSDSWSETVVYAATGGYNGYAVMDGTQSIFAYQTRDSKINFSDEYTFETWIRVKSGSSTGDVIMDKSGVFAFEISSKTSTSYAFIFQANGNTLNSSNSGKQISLNEWVHIAISRNANKTMVFVNGELYDESTSNFKLTDSNNAFNVAERYHSGYSGRIVADFDEVRLSTLARYNSNFTPSRTEQFVVDDNTSCYLTFQNIPSFNYLEGFNGKYRFRFKDSSSNLAFRFEKSVWNYEETENELSNNDLDLIASLIKVFPNPSVNDFVEITIEDNDLVNSRNVQFNMFDLNGRIIELHNTYELSSNKWQLQLSSLEAGVYILQVDGGNFKMNRKIIIE